MSIYNVFISRKVPDAGLKKIYEICDVNLWEKDKPPTRDELLNEVKGMDGLFCFLTDNLDVQVMDAAGPQLKVISNYAVGYDNIDIHAATVRGIVVGNTPGVLTDTTADLAFALLLSGARRLVEGADYVKNGKWQTWEPMGLLGYDLSGATLGIIGLGQIGKAVAKRASGFGMKVVYYSRSAGICDLDGFPVERCETLDELLEQSDFISIHVPLTNDTRNMIGEPELKKMKSNGVLVNTARGAVINPDALYYALKNHEIAYAALDVTDPEPINMDSPLLKLPNCIIVPHIGSASHRTRTKMAEMASENLVAGLKGQLPPNCVNPEALNKL